MKINIIFYSMYGHVHKMALAEAEGAREVPGAEVRIFQAAELVPDHLLEKSGAKAARQAFADIPIAKPEDIADADGLLFGTPTRFGNMCSQMRNLFDQCGPLWMKGAFINKFAGIFCATGSQHGGQETTMLTMAPTLLHLGMIIVGVPYDETRLLTMKEISGGSPYAASTMSDLDGSRWPTENELAIARTQGRHLAEITATYVKGRPARHEKEVPSEMMSES